VRRDGSSVQRLTAAQVYHERKHLVDQEMTDSLQTNAAARVAAAYLAPGPVNEEIGDIGKGKYVTALGLTGTKPCRASCEPRSQIPSCVETEALKAAGKSRTNRRPNRQYSKDRKLRNRNVRNDK